MPGIRQSMPHGEEGSSPLSKTVIMDKISSGTGNPLSIDDSRIPITKLDIPDPSYPQISPPPSRRSSIRLNPSPNRSSSPHQHVSPRRSKLESPVFASLREKDDPYFLALPDASRSKILSNSAPDLNTLPHPPPRVHRRANRDSVANGNGRLMVQLHSSRRHSSLGLPSQPSTDNRPLSRRSSVKPPFRLSRRTTTSSGSSSPNYGSDSESEIFDDDHSNVGSAVSTRPSSYSSTASYSETFLRSSASANNLDGKTWKRGSLTPSLSVLDLSKKRDSAILPERDHLETEECRFLESEYHRYIHLRLL